MRIADPTVCRWQQAQTMRVEPRARFVVIVGATPQLQVLHRHLSAISKRDHMMELEEAALR